MERYTSKMSRIWCLVDTNWAQLNLVYLHEIYKIQDRVESEK